MKPTREQNRINQQRYRQNHPDKVRLKEREREVKFKKIHGVSRSTIWKMANPTKAREATISWKQRHPEKAKQYQENRKLTYDPVKRRKTHIKELYGITIEEYENILKSQNNCCALCFLPFGSSNGLKPHIDHNHKNGKIRGILHGQCNIGLGSFKDDPILCEKAAAYLRKTVKP